MIDLLILDVETRAEREALIEALIIAEFERDTEIEAWIASVLDSLDA